MKPGWKTSLRLRLVIGFILVSVPAMLASAYVAARLISDAFESNVEQWLGETSRFLSLEIREAGSEAHRVANVIGQRLRNASDDDLRHPADIEKDISILGTVGYDLFAIYAQTHEIVYASRPFRSLTDMPTEDSQGIFQIETEGKHYLMAGAVQTVRIRDRTYRILVGTWLDEVYLGGIRVVTSLDVQLFSRVENGFVQVLRQQADQAPAHGVLANIAARLTKDEDTVFDLHGGNDGNLVVYAALRDVSAALVGFASIGLKRDAGFFERIGRWHLFPGIFLFGVALSTIVGVVMSGILVRPLNALTRGIRAITAGDFHQRVPARGGHEIAELATGFNTMAEQLGRLHDLEAEVRRRDRLSALGQAAMVIAHEVRNPLGIIKTSTEVVRNRVKLGPAEDRMLGYVIDEVRRIETLVRDFLDFAQPKAPIKTRVPLRSIIDRVAAFAAPELATRHVDIRVSDMTEGAAVTGDPDQLHQACLNLVLNAMDALPQGGSITARLTEDDDMVFLTIEDTGAGIPADILGQVFNPFFTTKAKGTGLGLAKVLSVALAHGGTATCASPPGGGASFTIAIPKVAATEGR